MHPGVRAHVPAVHHGRLVELEHEWDIGAERRARRSRSSGCTSCAGRRTGSRWWRRSRPSTTTPQTRHARWRCARAALFCVVVYVLLPLGLGGTLGTAGDRRRRDAHRVLHRRRSTSSSATCSANVMIFCVVAGLVLSMNTATMDGSRALYGIAKDGMTIRQLGDAQPVPRARRCAMTRRRDPEHLADHVLRRRARDPRGVQHRLRVRDVRGARRRSCCCARTGPNWPRPVRLSELLGAARARCCLSSTSCS